MMSHGSPVQFQIAKSSPGLCDINEGSATSEERCKSPTSGNMFFCVLLQDNTHRVKKKIIYQCLKSNNNASRILEMKITVSKRGDSFFLDSFTEIVCSLKQNYTKDFLVPNRKITRLSISFRLSLLEMHRLSLMPRLFERIFPFPCTSLLILFRVQQTVINFL